MNKLELHIIKQGLHTTLQDAGRSGYQKMGVPIGGALDRKAAFDANQIVGNDKNCPVIEVTVMGPEIAFTQDCLMAITGANLNPLLNNKPIATYELLDVPSNSKLSFGRADGGCRAYIAIAGNWEIKNWLGSVSAASFNAVELTPDSLLRKGSKITIDERKTRPVSNITVYPPAFSNTMRVRVKTGPEFEWFTKKTIAKFFSIGHQLSQDSNRMGIQLENQILKLDQKKELISSGIIPGTIQVTHKGMPIILLADAQTTGGYPRIAKIIEEDLDKMAQLKPGDQIWFSLAD
jgi:antagonist of KipI